MTEIQVKKRFFAPSSHQRQKVPVCQEVRDFIAESYKCQTLYANCEGFYPRRIVSCRDEKLLEEFIFNSMYYDCSEKQSQSNSDRIMHATQICSEMILLSKKYSVDDEIHFSVVWVYCFEYERKIKKAVPVFKIFKRKSGSEAVFLDTLLKFYESWDCYLENAEFPESFLCVPRHGEYHFDDESNMLVLEYVRSMKQKTDDNACLFDALPKEPFSQKAVRPLLTVMMSLGEMAKQITRCLQTFCSYLFEKKGPIFNAAIFIIAIWRKIRSLETAESISSVAFMLLNICIETNDGADLLKFEYWTKHSATFIPELLTLSDEQRALREISEEKAHFFELLLNDEKNWLEILKSFCFLFRRFRSILTLVSRIAPNFLIIENLCWLLSIIEKISDKIIMGSDSCKLNKIENCTLNVNGDHENGNFEFNSSGSYTGQATHNFSSSGFHNQYKKPSTVDFETQNTALQFKYDSLEKILSNLPSIETVSIVTIYNLLLEKSSKKFPEEVQLCPTDISQSSQSQFTGLGIFVGEQDGYGFFLFPEAYSISRLTWCISQFFRTEFSFKFQGTFTAEIISHFGKSLGFLFFPLELAPLGLFPLEVIKNEKGNLLECALKPQ